MSSKGTTIVMKIVNMTCSNCENHIENALSKVEGITLVKASYSTGMVTVNYDPSIVNPDRMERILEKEDYYIKKESSNGEPNASNTGKGTREQGSYDLSEIASIGIIIFTVYMLANRFGLFNIFKAFPVAKDGMGYGMLLVIGLLTSVHCVAMCGGICLSQCVPQKDGALVNKFTALRPSLLYNIGRVISYTIIGGIVGAIGSVVSFSGTMKGAVQILAGVFMVIMGLNMLNVFPWLRRLNPRMPKIFAKKLYTKRVSNSPLYIGLLNGLMPCGPLQAMQLYALSTGSPVRGALSMFLFSIGTVPLMFAFGALSSFLSKKFTGKMMAASAVLVVILGIFMFNSGIGLTGIVFPSMPISVSNSESAKVAEITNGVQIVRTGLSSGRYEAITVQKDIPVQWIIEAERGDINGCNNAIIIPKYNLSKDLSIGDNLIEFVPTESGTISFSCWMGMIRSRINVVDDLEMITSNQ